MTTAIQLLDTIRRILDSNLDEETVVASLRALIHGARDDDGDWMLLDVRRGIEVAGAACDAHKHENDAGSDHDFEVVSAYNRGLAEGRRERFEEIAAQRDAIAVKLHTIGKARLSMSDQERRRAGAEWLRDEFRLHDLPPRQARNWLPRELLPARGAWCDVLSADSQYTAIAHWDGDAFILMRRRRLLEGERWALRA